MTAQHRAPAAPRRITNKMIAIAALAALLVVLAVVVIAVRANASDGLELDTTSAAYHDGYLDGVDLGNDPSIDYVTEGTALAQCANAVMEVFPDYTEQEIWDASNGCADGWLEAQA